MSNKTVLRISILILAIFVLIAVFAPLLAPYDPNVQSGKPFEKPSAQHLLGTNDVGHDLLSEIIVGTRFSLAIGFCVAAICMVVAVGLGVLAGYYGGIVDTSIMRTVDFFLTIPYIPMVVLLSALISGGFLSIVIILSVFNWAETTRYIRAQTQKIKKKDYILNIKAMGASDLYILRKHVLRELSPMVAYRFTMCFKKAILSESTLSFLGLGSPTIKSWGTILYYAQKRNAFSIGAWPWWVIPPGVLITLFAFALMLFSYSFEEQMDKRLAVKRS